MTRTALEQLGPIIADAIDDLGDAIERHRQRPAAVEDARCPVGQELLENRTQIVAEAHEHLIEVQRRRPVGPEVGNWIQSMAPA